MTSGANHINIRLGLIILMLTLVGCGGSVSTPIEIHVADHESESGLDSTMVLLLRSHASSNWQPFDTLWTDENGVLETKLKAEEGWTYKVQAHRHHYEPITDPSGGSYLNEAVISVGDSNWVTLELLAIAAPDPDRFTRIQKEVTIKDMIAAMRSDTWQFNYLPRLSWEDVPALMATAPDTSFLHSYPHHPRTTYLPDSTRVGLTALWLIEAIRKQHGDPERGSGLLPPSRVPILGTRHGNPKGFNSVEQQTKAVEAYQTWWETYQENHDQAARTNPLVGKGLSWM